MHSYLYTLLNIKFHIISGNVYSFVPSITFGKSGGSLTNQLLGITNGWVMEFFLDLQGLNLDEGPKLIWPPWPAHLGVENMISFKL